MKSPYQFRRQSMPKHLPPRQDTGQDPVVVRLCIAMLEKLEGYAHIIAAAQFSSGCRAIEILDLVNSDVRQTGHVFIRARKGSVQRVVYLPEILPHVSFKGQDRDKKVFKTFTYFKYYKALIRAAGVELPRTLERQVVSNIFRRAAADQSGSFDTKQIELPQEFLGHKRPYSTRFYTNKQGVTHGSSSSRDTVAPKRKDR